LEGVLERITYANEETGYTIARVATERTGGSLTHGKSRRRSRK
jgi:exodeoxyribonuclease V alpha subunit